MGKRLQILRLAVIVSVGMMFSSCGNVDIVKRKYRPGFHVDITKKKQKSKGNPPAGQVGKEKTTVEKRQRTVNSFEQGETARNNKVEIMPQPTQAIDETASASLESTPQVKKVKEKVLKAMDDLIIKPFRELKREKMGREIRRAIFNQEEESRKWSIGAIISIIVGVIALCLVITAFVLWVTASSGFWWILGIVGLALAFTAIIMGAINIERTGALAAKGKGLAISGMTGGIMAAAYATFYLFAGFILPRFFFNKN